MANVNISQLPAGTPTLASVIPADNASGTVTEKYSIADVLSLVGPGPTGPAGPAGPAGPQGEPGATGPVGAEGAIISDTTQAGGGAVVTNIVTLTQSQYDAISVKDPNTAYFIQ